MDAGGGVELEAQGIPAEVADYAVQATERAVRRNGRSLHDTRALRAYFRKVVERRLVRHHGGTCAAARVVAGCVLADLVDSGRSPEEAFAELSRGWGSELPGSVLEELRQRLCA